MWTNILPKIAFLKSLIFFTITKTMIYKVCFYSWYTCHSNLVLKTNTLWYGFTTAHNLLPVFPLPFVQNIRDRDTLGLQYFPNYGCYNSQLYFQPYFSAIDPIFFPQVYISQLSPITSLYLSAKEFYIFNYLQWENQPSPFFYQILLEEFCNLKLKCMGGCEVKCEGWIECSSRVHCIVQ